MQNRDEGDKMGEDMREETIDERREMEEKGAEMRAAMMEKRANTYHRRASKMAFRQQAKAQKDLGAKEENEDPKMKVEVDEDI